MAVIFAKQLENLANNTLFSDVFLLMLRAGTQKTYLSNLAT